MFLVSGPDLVIATSRAGVIGSFPTANCRTLKELDDWLTRITQETLETAPYAPNLIVHRSNQRLQDDLDLVAKHRAPLVIASVGNPAPILDKIHSYGGLVFADIASMRHAEKAIAAGADGLILLSSGAGGGKRVGLIPSPSSALSEKSMAGPLSSLAASMTASPCAPPRPWAVIWPTWERASSRLVRAWQSSDTKTCW